VSEPVKLPLVKEMEAKLGKEMGAYDFLPRHLTKLTF
jgi:hypothetical protein